MQQDVYSQLEDHGVQAKPMAYMQITNSPTRDVDAPVVVSKTHTIALQLAEGASQVDMEAHELAVWLFQRRITPHYLGYIQRLLEQVDKAYATEFRTSYDRWSDIRYLLSTHEDLSVGSKTHYASVQPSTQSAELLVDASFNLLLTAQELMNGSRNGNYAREKLAAALRCIESACDRDTRIGGGDKTGGAPRLW